MEEHGLCLKPVRRGDGAGGGVIDPGGGGGQRSRGEGGVGGGGVGGEKADAGGGEASVLGVVFVSADRIHGIILQLSQPRAWSTILEQC